MPSRREFIGTLGATLGVLAGRRAAASAPGGPRRGESSTLNVSTDMRAFGFPNMTPNTPGLDATPILNEAIRLAGPDRFTTIVADPGTYEFWLDKELGTYVTMSDVHGLTIDLQGSSLIFRGTPGNATTQASALIATNCSQITRTPVNKDITVRDNYVVNTPGRGMFFQSIVTGSASNDLVQLASAAYDANGNGSFAVTNIASDSANQIQVAPAGRTVGDPVVPGHDASATVVIPAGQPAKPPVGPLTFLMADSSGARFTPTVMGTWPDFQFAVPAGAAPGAAALQISTPERPVARGGMFVASAAAHNAKPTTQ